MNDFQKLLAGGVGLFLILTLIFHFSGCSSFDFSKLKYGLNPTIVGESTKEKVAKKPASATAPLPEFEPETRSQAIREERAKVYVNTATRDYYNGSYEEALRRLERAKQYDPGSYEALRLSGQIQFEQNYYRKAFNDWSRATQLPNDDQAMSRDLDVVKRLIRYCRHEIDRLQVTIHRNPDDRIAMEKLKELRMRMQD